MSGGPHHSEHVVLQLICVSPRSGAPRVPFTIDRITCRAVIPGYRGANNLALTLLAQGDLPGALALQQQVLDARRRVLGEEHPQTLASMGNLAKTLRAHGELAHAWAPADRVLELRRRVLGEAHPHTLTAMIAVALTLWQAADRTAAFELMLVAAKGREGVLGRDHPDTQSSLRDLAAMREALGLCS